MFRRNIQTEAFHSPLASAAKTNRVVNPKGLAKSSVRRFGRRFRGPKETGLLTQQGLLNRESESSGGESWGGKGTVVVSSAPRNLGRETESAAGQSEDAETRNLWQEVQEPRGATPRGSALTRWSPSSATRI